MCRRHAPKCLPMKFLANCWKIRMPVERILSLWIWYFVQQMHAMPAELSKRLALPRWEIPYLMQVDAGTHTIRAAARTDKRSWLSSSRQYVSGDDRTAPINEPMKSAGQVTKEEAAFVYSRLGVGREMIGRVFLHENEAGGQLSHLMFLSIDRKGLRDI